jgi:hypothetical protein
MVEIVKVIFTVVALWGFLVMVSAGIGFGFALGVFAALRFRR